MLNAFKTIEDGIKQDQKDSNDVTFVVAEKWFEYL